VAENAINTRLSGNPDLSRLTPAQTDRLEQGFATLQILYEGKTADSALTEKRSFDDAFEDLFCDRTEDELLAIKRKYGATGDIKVLRPCDASPPLGSGFIRRAPGSSTARNWPSACACITWVSMASPNPPCWPPLRRSKQRADLISRELRMAIARCASCTPPWVKPMPQLPGTPS
jgi:hypothetical protein